MKDNSLKFPTSIVSYLNGGDELNELQEKWEGYDFLTQQIIVAFSKPTNSIEFLLEIDSIVRKNKFNNKLKDILDE